MSRRDEINLGQLVRERHHEKSVSVGFTTYTGTVTAASGWDREPERKWVRPAMDRSYEALLHEVSYQNFFLITNHPEVHRHLLKEYLERAIGVIYLPETERYSHYFFASMAEQFDAVVHYDESRALEPLDKNPGWEKGEFPETFPTGL